MPVLVCLFYVVVWLQVGGWVCVSSRTHGGSTPLCRPLSQEAEEGGSKRARGSAWPRSVGLHSLPSMSAGAAALGRPVTAAWHPLTTVMLSPAGCRHGRGAGAAHTVHTLICRTPLMPRLQVADVAKVLVQRLFRRYDVVKVSGVGVEVAVG